jgi:hypothetical protein
MASENLIDASLRTIKTQAGEVPFLKDLWNFFSAKGVKTSFITINSELSFEVDLEVCEGLGCPIQIFTNRESVEAKWDVIAKTLKNRKIADEDADKEWLKGIEKKWILPKNIIVKPTKFEWTTLKEILQSLSTSRIDILKIESNDESERMLLYSLIESGARPGIILVQYTCDPDSNVPAMLAAGHLQNTGYRLMSNKDNWFLYMFNDLCLYDSCSWRGTKVNNPLVQYIGDQFRISLPTSTSTSTSTSVSSTTEEKQSTN